MNGVSVLPSIKRSARSKQSAVPRCYFNSPFSSDLYRFRKYAGGQTERRRVLYSVSSPPARWDAASATVKFTTLYGKYHPPTLVMASPTHSNGTNGHFGDGGVAARNSNQNSGITFFSVDSIWAENRIYAWRKNDLV